MHFTIFSTLKSLFSFSSKEKAHAQQKIAQDDHTYVRGNITTRGPCPALNALANQGYLPRDGKNITTPHVEAALTTALHFSAPLAHALAHSLSPLLRKDTGTFDLVDMRRHNVVEHDRSLTRLDFRQGDNYTLQPRLLASLLEQDGPDQKYLAIGSLARSYLRRKKECDTDEAGNLPINLWFVNVLQTVSFLYTVQIRGEQVGQGARGEGLVVPREVARVFYEEERFDEVILRNGGRRTLMGLLGTAVRLLWKVTFGA